MNNAGVNRLARVLQDRITDNKNTELILDFGSIQADGSLLTNTFPVPIPATDYLVCRSLTFNPNVALTETTETLIHKHDVVLPEKMRNLTAGDRVLVAWVQNDAVVIDIIVPATEIGG